MRVFLTIAVDLVMENIQEPVRFLIEAKAKIFPATERFWYFVRKPLQEQFVLKVKEVSFIFFIFRIYFLIDSRLLPLNPCKIIGLHFIYYAVRIF